MQTIRLTMSQALIRFLINQYVERDGSENRFFAGCFGIFGHGNVAGVGQALYQYPEFKYYLPRGEQAMVHTAAAFAKAKNRLQTFACTSSIGPGATNMLSGAAAATINRIPVLLLPGDIFARRNVAPVLQQLEAPFSQEISVNDCFKPVSRYWDRINRAEQLATALPEAMRVLTSPAETGAATLSLPQDVQTESFDYPVQLFEKRIWTIPRTRPDRRLQSRAVEWIRSSRRPVIIAGGGIHYSDATEVLGEFADRTGIPVGETQAGKGALPFNHRSALGAMGVSGTKGANIVARDADLVIGIGTRYSDFTTASKTAFQNEKVRFININVAEFDASKHAAIPLAGDARVVLEDLADALKGFEVQSSYREEILGYNREWDEEVERIYNLKHGPPVSQGEVIGAVNETSEARDVVLCAAGSLPGDLHKLWRTRDPKGYHLEYGYSCMGYEIPGGIGVKLANPDREVFVMVGDGSYLMTSEEIATAIQEGIKLNIVLINNYGFASIGGLSESLGTAGFGTHYRRRDDATGHLTGQQIQVNYAEHARSLGAEVIETRDIDSLKKALKTSRASAATTVIVIECDRHQGVGSYETWWDVPVSEVAEVDSVRKAFEAYNDKRKAERFFV